MEKDYYERKQERILTLYTKLLDGEILDKRKEAEAFHVSSRSLQRDIDDLRVFLSNRAMKTGIDQLIVYDKKQKGYHLTDSGKRKMTNSEVLAVCKIILESRAFMKEDLYPIISKLLDNCSPPENKRIVSELISNEQYHYVEPHHHVRFVEQLWNIGTAVQEHLYMEIQYGKLKNKEFVKRIIKPVGIMFSEFYFYLIAFRDDLTKNEVSGDIYPAIYRIDRIKQFRIINRHFSTPYRDRFEEGEFRKRVQFMYGGKLQRVVFEYDGLSLEAVLDRLPTANIIKHVGKTYTISAEVFGDGIDMWIRSQGETVRLLQKYLINGA